MNNSKNFKPLFDRRGKSGIYSVVLSLILLAVLIVVNLIVGSLPARYTMLDTTDSGQYEISGTSESFLAGVKENVTVYYIVPEGYEDATLSAFLDRYVSLSSKLTLKSVDPLDNPAFLDNYSIFLRSRAITHPPIFSSRVRRVTAFSTRVSFTPTALPISATAVFPSTRL